MMLVRPSRIAGLSATCVALFLLPCALAVSARADGFPAGYSVDVDNSGSSTSEYWDPAHWRAGRTCAPSARAAHAGQRAR
jgi:hypothetical protein